MLYILYSVVNTCHCTLLWSIKMLPSFSCSKYIKISKRKKKSVCAMPWLKSLQFCVRCLFLLLSLNQKNRLFPQLFPSLHNFSRRREFKLNQFEILKYFYMKWSLAASTTSFLLANNLFSFLIIMSLHIFYILLDLVVCALVLTNYQLA